MDFIPQHHEVSGFFALPADDAGADAIGIAPPGKCWRTGCSGTEDIWPRPILLLRATHSADTSGCGDCFAAAHGFGYTVAVHEPPRDESAFAARIRLEY